jgi:hypothetical protein
MQGNVGGLDRICASSSAQRCFRCMSSPKGNLRLVGLIGLIPLYTGLLGNCSLYCILGISTRKGAEAGRVQEVNAQCRAIRAA